MTMFRYLILIGIDFTILNLRKNTQRRVIFSTLFLVFLYVVKHCLSCLIFIINCLNGIGLSISCLITNVFRFCSCFVRALFMFMAPLRAISLSKGSRACSLLARFLFPCAKFFFLEIAVQIFRLSTKINF